MSDERLRELERVWRESQAPEDHAALLSERRRVNLLRPQALELAAYAGHPAARLALGQAEAPPASARAWFAGLERFGKAAGVAAALALAEHVARVHRQLVPEHTGYCAHDQAALDATRAWLETPCEAHRQAARPLVERTSSAIHHAVQAAARADRNPREVERAAKLAARDASRALSGMLSEYQLGFLGMGTTPQGDLDQVRAALGTREAGLERMRAGVAAWALTPVELQPEAPPPDPVRPPAYKPPTRGAGLYGGYYHPDTVVLRAGSKKDAAAQFFAELPPEQAGMTSAKALTQYVGRISYSGLERRLWFSTRSGGQTMHYVVPPGRIDDADWVAIQELEPPASLTHAIQVRGKGSFKLLPRDFLLRQKGES